MATSEDRSIDLTKDQFAELVIAKLAERFLDIGEKRSLIYDRSRFAVVCRDADGNPEQVFGLSNAFEEYGMAQGGLRGAVLDRYLDFFSGITAKDVPASFENARSSLLPVVRDRYQVQALQLRFAIENGISEKLDPLSAQFGLPHRVIADHFAVGLGYDLPETMIQISESQLRAWNVSFDRALEVALDNLRSRSRAPFIEAVEGVYLSPFQDSYDAARILLTEMFESLSLNGSPVALMPNHENLIITGSSDRDGLQSVLNVTEPMAERARAMPALPVVLDKGEWAPYTVEDAELAERFNVLRISALVRAYTEQRGLVDAWNIRNGRSLSVSPFFATQRKNGTVSSCSIWPDGGPALIPAAESVVFTTAPSAESRDIVACGSWRHVVEIVGGRMKKTDYCPELYLVEGFPAATELARIGMDVVELK